MKLLFCESCGDIVAPLDTPNFPRWCSGGEHAVWWVDPARGILRLYERDGRYDPDTENGGHTWSRKRSPHRAFVLGLHNGLLTYPSGLSRESIDAIIGATPDSYLFARQRSLIIRIRPGETSDTDWAEVLP